MNRMYDPLVSCFETVSTRKFVDDFESNWYVHDLAIDVCELVARIPEQLHERMRDDALKGIRSFQGLVKSTVCLTAGDYVNTPDNVKRPKRMSFNATDMESLETNVEYFLFQNYCIWDQHEFQEYKASIEDQESPSFIGDAHARDNIAIYVMQFVSFANARIPHELNESECFLDSETDESDFEDYWQSKMTGESSTHDS